MAYCIHRYFELAVGEKINPILERTREVSGRLRCENWNRTSCRLSSAYTLYNVALAGRNECLTRSQFGPKSCMVARHRSSSSSKNFRPTQCHPSFSCEGYFHRSGKCQYVWINRYAAIFQCCKPCMDI